MANKYDPKLRRDQQVLVRIGTGFKEVGSQIENV